MQQPLAQDFAPRADGFAARVLRIRQFLALGIAVECVTFADMEYRGMAGSPVDSRA